ncbi:hypothetical protein IKZ40_05145 [bacterium]|nr:hypothetical protein [bacterium]
MKIETNNFCLVIALCFSSLLLTAESVREDGNPRDIGWGYGLEEGREAWDLGVVYLERSPRYPNEMQAIGGCNRPKPGDKVKWTARLYKNGGTLPDLKDLSLRWVMNTKNVAVTEIKSDPREKDFYFSSFEWTVPSDYRCDYTKPLTNTLTAVIVPPNGLVDRNPSNDFLRVYMDGLPITVPVYRETFERYTDPEKLSFFDRMNDCFEWTNKRFEAAKYPMSPYGIIDRLRVDKLYFVDKEFLETRFTGDPDAATTVIFNEQGPLGNYRGYDWYWIGQNFWWNGHGIFSKRGYGAFCHEFGHSLQIPDTYIFNIRKEQNDVTGEDIPCAWMDTPGKRCMMRDSYTDYSHFSELTAYEANRQAGVIRKQPSGNVVSHGRSYKGWFVNELPEKALFKLYSQSGRELLGAPVKIYRCAERDYMIGVTNIVMKELRYPEGGVLFDPQFRKENGKRGENTFFITVGEGEGRRSLVLDQLHFNYLYAKGQKHLASFSFTNDYRETDLGYAKCSVRKNTASWTVALSDSRGASLKIANSLPELKKKSFLPFCSSFLHEIKEGEKEIVFYLQARSGDFVPTPIYEVRGDLTENDRGSIRVSFKAVEE